MSDSSAPHVVEADSALSRTAAIVGVGETDYVAAYRAARTEEPDFTPPHSHVLAHQAFERALADSGLDRADIDGLGVSLMYGDADPEAIAKAIGVQPRYIAPAGGIMAGVIPPAVAALAAGRCNTIALLYSAASRTVGRQFGGETYRGLGPRSYYYYHPWGWSSQAAHWALLFQYYQLTYRATEEDLGCVAVTLRQHAMLNDNAIMRDPLTIRDYLASRYIVRPMHLFDLCLVNDGGVCLILRRQEMARDMPHPPVFVAGWGDAEVHGAKLHYMIRERLRPQFQEAGAQALGMAGVSLSEIDHFQGYDASSIHLINQIEGYGFVEPGEGLHFCKEGHMAIGGRLPVNTSGGMLSGAYMHGWNHVAEAVAQLRHEAGPRQVDGIETSMFSLATTESAHPLVLTRGGA
jgi:acetyl-CoA acetyltransferase